MKGLSWFGITFVLLVLALIFRAVWPSPFTNIGLGFTKTDSTAISETFYDWVRDAVWYTAKLNNKPCGTYSDEVNCSKLLEDFNRCKLTATYHLKEFDDIGEYTIEGVVEHQPRYGIVGCKASLADWKEQITPRGTYRKITWYGWVEINFDTRTLSYSDEPGKVYTCEQKGLGIDCKGLLTSYDYVKNSKAEFYIPLKFCGDGICSPEIGETSENCPADCPPPVVPPPAVVLPKKPRLPLWLIILGVIVAISLFIPWKRLRR